MSQQRDAVDRIVAEWTTVRPDLDSSPIAVVGRISRLSRLVDRRLAENFARHGIEDWMYDVLATLRRIGEPHRLTPGELVRRTMVTTGAITNRVDRLEQRGLVRRVPSSTDRRSVLVELTPDGLELVDAVAASHLETERSILAVLSDRQRGDLVKALRALLVQLGDADPAQEP